MTRRAYPRLRSSILLLQKPIIHVAYNFFRHRHLRTHVLRSTCLLDQIRGCRGFGKQRYRAILADKPRQASSSQSLLGRDSGYSTLGSRWGSGKDAATITFKSVTMPFVKVVTKSPEYAQSSPLADRWQYHHVWEFDGDRKNRVLWIAEIENQGIMRVHYVF
jgi:hypothetical protein